MAHALILETTFLVDLERECRDGSEGRAHRFLVAHRGHELHLTFTVVGELACGLSLAEREKWESFLRPFDVIGFTLDVGWQYGEIYRHLQRNGQLIGANDLWIAATAVSRELPLVTRNARHFGRVPRLQVVDYAC